MSSKFTRYDLGQLKRGSTVLIELSSAANVRLMDRSNLNAYQRGKQHRYTGGLVTRSPYRMVIPRDGRWFVTVDVVGLRKGTRSAIRIEEPRAPLPAAPSISSGSLNQIRHELPPNIEADGRTWDVFISHASEDKETVARPLAAHLESLGISVWLDDAVLRIGDSLRRNIDSGLARSSFGVVIFSKSFFAKGWPQYELDGLVTRSVSGEQSILPIWHEITKDQVMAHTPSLADKIARSTSTHTVRDIAEEIAAVVGEHSDMS